MNPWKLIFLAVLSSVFCSNAVAQGTPSISTGRTLDIGGVAELIGDKIKEAKAATLLNLNLKVGGALYLPIWVFHDLAGVDYLEIGAGGYLKEGGEASPLVSATFNLPALSGRLWSSEWARAHIRRTKFPPIFFGPYVKVPMPERVWLLRNEVGLMISIRLRNGGG